MSTSDVFKEFYSRLVETLPMCDAVFVAKLYSRDILSREFKNQLNCLENKTPAAKATLFLDTVIEPSITSGVGSKFDDLLNVMEGSDHESMKELAQLIRTSLRRRSSNNDNGSYSIATSGPTPKPSPLDVSRLKYVRLALVEKEDVTLKDKFLNELTKLTLQGDVDKILKKKKPLIGLRNIFHYENESCPRLILIMGGPGIGKTTLANEICAKWAKDGFLAEDFDVVVLISLRSVQQRSLKDVIKREIGKENYQQLKKSLGSRCLIILEGFDEMSVEHRQNDPFLIRLIKECNKLEEATIIITSRPHACERIDAGRRIEVVGFGEDEIKEFVKLSFPNDIQSAKEFQQQLDEYPQLQSLSYVPMNLVMLVDIFNCSEKKLPSTLTELYQLFIVMTLKRQVNKPSVGKPVCSSVAVTVPDDVEKSLYVMLKGIPKETVGIIHCLSKLAYQGFFEWFFCGENEFGQKRKDPKIIFTKSDLIQCHIEVTSDFDGYGLLKATHTHQLSVDCNIYSFNHLTIQEFLCAVYISSLSQQEQLYLLKKHFDEYPNVFTFVSGLTGLTSSEMFQLICSTLMSNDGITAMRCIYESKQCSGPHQSVSPFTLNVSGCSLLPYDFVCLSNVLSHCLVSKLAMWGCRIGNRGAEIIAKHYSKKATICTLLEELYLSSNDLTSEGIVHVMKIVRTNTTTLRLLNVCGNLIGDHGMAAISEALQHNKSLANILVSNCGLSVKGALYISQLLNITRTLQKLHLMGNDIGDDGMAAISEALQHNISFTSLNVRECGFSVKGAISISKMMVNCSLQNLDMSYNNIGDDGISAIAGLLGSCNINCLSVTGCGITLIGARSLATALLSMANQAFTELGLLNNPITVEGALLILKYAVHNMACQDVQINKEYESNEEVKKYMVILRSRQQLQEESGSLVSYYNHKIPLRRSNSDVPSEEVMILVPISTENGTMEMSSITQSEDDNHS